MQTIEKSQHTAGPWRVGPYYRHEVVSEHGVICCAPLETGQTQANARLIAAAPELLQALIDLQKEVRNTIKFDVKKHYSLMVADVCASKAIAKAEGNLP